MAFYVPYFNYICGELLYGTRLSNSAHDLHRDIWGWAKRKVIGCHFKTR